MDISAILLLAVRLTLALVFGLAGISKLLDRRQFRITLAEFGTPAPLLDPASVLVPWLELAGAAAVISSATSRWGAAGVALLLLGFSAAVSINLSRGRKPNCRCFGQIHSGPIGWTTLARNGVLAVLAGIVAWQGPTHAGVWDIFLGLCNSRYAVPSLALGFAALVLLNVWVLIQLMRQNGRVLMRLDALETKTGTAKAPGLPVNSPAPSFKLKDLEGRVWTSDEVYEQASKILLLFTDPDCHACESMLPDLAEWQGEHAGQLRIVPVSRGEVESNRSRFVRHGIRDVLLQEGREVADAFTAELTPSAVLITSGLIASSLAVGPEAIAKLVESTLLPAKLHKGDFVPSMRLADLAGNAVDLSTLRRALVIFWHPSCGFCAHILPELKAWEQAWPAEAPTWLIISAGSPENNRKQAFQSRVVNDPHFAAGQVFGATGTPAAVLVDDEGRVASELVFGADDVLALMQRVRRNSHARGPNETGPTGTRLNLSHSGLRER